MKKILLTLSAVAVLGFAANAQTEKGKFMLGGQVNYDGHNVKDSDFKINSLSIVPNVGYFVADNIAVGLGLGYQWTKAENNENSSETGSAFQLAPFGRMYSNNAGPVKFFGQLSVPMSWGERKINDDKVSTISNYGVELAPGLAFFPTSNIGIEFKVKGLYFQSSTDKAEATDIETTTNSYGLNANSLAPTVGVTFHF